MASRIVFRLTKPLVSSLKRKGQFKGKCCNCGRKFRVGDSVLSKIARNNGRGSRKWYCLDCASKLNIWLKR